MNYSILVIDDDMSFLRWMDSQLSREGFAVIAAASGRLAMDVLKQKEIDLVITDMHMPVVDGYDIVSHVKELYPRMPILISTANSVNPRVRTALQFERVGFVRKPIDPANLKEAMLAIAPTLFASASSQSAA